MATGNSILKRACFQINGTSAHSMSTLANANTLVDGEIIQVIDGPSIDASCSTEDILKHSSRNVKEALNLCDFSFSGLLLVFQYGSRYTNQESLTVKLLKGLLGDHVISDCGVCVFTHGDLFESDMKSEASHCSFQEWCRQQGGDIQRLFEECNYRCVIFDNKTKEECKMKAQVNSFLALKSELKFYTKFDYEHSKQQREKFELEVVRPEWKKEIERKVLEIRSKLQGLELKLDLSEDEKFGEMHILLAELDSFQKNIPTSERSFTQLVTSLSLEIESRIKLLEFEKHLEKSKSTSEKDKENKTESDSTAKLSVKQKLQKLFHL